MSNEMEWVEKYRPKTIDDLILNENLKTIFKKQIEQNTTKNLMLHGKPGIGKTTLAKIIAKSIDCEVKFVDCSKNSSVETILGPVSDFAKSPVLGNQLKVIILDEADSLSKQLHQNSAQKALRGLTNSDYDDTRFIITCNYLNSMLEPLHSRCTPISLTYNIKDVLNRCINILKSEQINLHKQDILNFYNNIILHKYPDIRLIINYLELLTDKKNKKFEYIDVQSTEKINEVINKIKEYFNKKIKINDIRKYLLENVELFNNDYNLLTLKLFELFSDNEKCILIISEHIYQMSVMLDKEITFIAMLVNLSKHI